MMEAARRIMLAAACLAVLGACSLPIPKSNEPIVPTVYDLGPPRAYQSGTPGMAGTLSIPDVAGAEALDDGIVYRLLYEDRAQLQIYTRSRWRDDPAALMTERVRSRFAAVTRVVSPRDSARSDYTLRIELRDFSQSLESPERSYVTLRARATLVSSADRSVIAQREFDLRRDAAANAAGAVKALTEATDAFLEELVKWTVGWGKPAAGKEKT